MSKRARLEEQRAIEQQEELMREEEKQRAMQRRIYSAIVWRKYSNGIKIQDLTPDYYETAVELVKEHYIPQEILSRNAKVIEDPDALESYLYRIRFNLRDKKSIIALDESTDNDDAIAGFMIMKEVPKNQFSRIFSRVQLVKGEAHKKIVKFTNALNRHVFIYEEFDCDVFLRYYLMCIMPEYREKGLGFKFFQAGWDVARSLNIPVVMGLFSSFFLQKLATKFDMRMLREILYTRWTTKDNLPIFCDPGPGNYSCAIMAGFVPPPPEPEPPPPPTEEELEAIRKMTRQEKRAMKAKEKTMAEKELNAN